ncbi:FAD-dependent monooxygenase [Nocardia gamkensis]|uniref:FAD-dependent monooxygenase n=1 Tax=Nocardia gamkensis TaxID=352869 RepID=UPI0037C7638D
MSHDSEESNRILIVGAGPVGSLAAIILRRWGVACRVIDRAVGSATTSNACVVHARLMELLAHLGMTDRLVTRGRRARRMNYHFLGTGEIARLNFTQLDSSYPFMLNISQAETERILHEEHASLGGTIEWNTELLSVSTDSAGRITARVVNKADGREEILHPEWLIGCDGVHSTVRQQMGMTVVGGEYYADQMRMTDAPISGLPLSAEDLDYLVEPDRMTLLIPLPGVIHRLLVSDMSANPETEISQAAFQAVLDRCFDGTVTLGRPEWASNFTIRIGISDYRRGNVFLAGDAAHHHSPAGAQGMNLGMQDAYNLAWKLALVTKGEARETLLDTYEPQRRPAAEQVIARTQKLHDLLMAHGTPIAERLAIIREPGFIEQAVNGISGIGTTYRHTVSQAPGITPLGGLAAGDRAPDVALTARQRLHSLLHHPGHTLLVFQRDAHSASAVKALESRVARRFGDRVRCTVIASPDQRAAAPDGAIVADSFAAHKLYGAEDTDTLCLLHPDGHIHALCGLPEQEALLTSLGAVLT